MGLRTPFSYSPSTNLTIIIYHAYF
jgi:hypothetical protein